MIKFSVTTQARFDEFFDTMDEALAQIAEDGGDYFVLEAREVNE